MRTLSFIITLAAIAFLSSFVATPLALKFLTSGSWR